MDEVFFGNSPLLHIALGCIAVNLLLLMLSPKRTDVIRMRFLAMTVLWLIAALFIILALLIDDFNLSDFSTSDIGGILLLMSFIVTRTDPSRIAWWEKTQFFMATGLGLSGIILILFHN